MSGGSLADELRARSPEQLCELLLARPDLARPSPPDLSALAGRAATTASVRRAVEQLDTAQLSTLRAVAATSSGGGTAEPAAVAVALGADPAAQLQRLSALALLWRTPEGMRLVPAAREVLGLTPPGLEQRPAAAGVASALRPPELQLTELDQPAVDAVAAARVREVVRLLEELARRWGDDPPRVLKAGGLAVRDLARTASSLEVEAPMAAWLVELAWSAGLLGQDAGAPVPVFLPTTEVDPWARLDPGAAWARLAEAWLASSRAAHLVGTRALRSGTVTALSPQVRWPPVRAAREEVLGVLAGVAPGSAATPSSVLALLRWRRPLREPRGWQQVVGAVLREADWLGISAHGALSAAGRALVAGVDTATLARQADAMLPPAVEHVLLQADLTAVVPGPADPQLMRFLRSVSDVESGGGATVLRFTAASVRRGLDAGLSADEVLDTLRRRSHTPVPQPLEYLVRDVARRHGVSRVGRATAYLRSDDESALAAMLGDRSLAPAALRRIAPTVLVSQADPADLLDLLREAGYAPVREGADGTVVVSSGARRRAEPSRRAAERHPPPLQRAGAEALVAALRAASQAAPPPDAALPRDVDPSVTAATLREAADLRVPAWVGYADANGRASRRLVRVLRLDAGRVHVLDAAGAAQVLPLHRLTGARLAPPAEPGG